MESLPYIPGLKAAEPGPLSRFLPPLEEGTVSAWLMLHAPPAAASAHPSGWLIDPFGFSPRLAVEAARAGYRILVTVNNPITRFLMEMAARPPSEADLKAALAELGASRKGDERLETHLRSLYLTPCEKCGHEAEAESFLWRKGEAVPFARVYECKDCGDKGERPAASEDGERAHRFAAADGLHRARALERVAAVDDPERPYVHDAIDHYLPRPLYALATIINRLDSLNLPPERRRALTALVLVACDAGNDLWAYPSERPRPKALNTPQQFRELNLWTMLERGLTLWNETAAPVPCVSWPEKLPETGGICIYEGRLRDLAHDVKRELPITAAIGSIPRPNQAFWTLSALWAGWLWGRAAVDPFRVALRRRRYDWTWSATALNAAFRHLFEIVALGTPFFGLLPEVEPAFLTSAFVALSAAGFDIKGIALRTEHDPLQLLWERGERLEREDSQPDVDGIRAAMQQHLAERSESARYIYLHTAALSSLSEAHALKQREEDFESALRRTNAAVQAALSEDPRFLHLSQGESLEAGTWGWNEPFSLESLADRVEIAVVNYLQQHPDSIYLEIEDELCRQFPGLLTPSKALLYAVLDSYADKRGASWRLRPEDTSAARRLEIGSMTGLVEAVGKRLRYGTRKQDKWLVWEDSRKPVQMFYTLASALVGRAIVSNPYPDVQPVLVVPGGRAALIAYKQQRDPVLAQQMKAYRVTKYRLWRAISQLPILTRATLEEQLLTDPVLQAEGQMMMF
ncbi:MAG TPA: hypothetical protein VMJ64_16985 [Anaerolineales bacterium]|nr:hypothetical protein [Anaerolineales bacterium]